MDSGSIVVSAFGPWGALPHNPTAAVLERLAADARWSGRLRPLVFAVDSAALTPRLAGLLAEGAPAVWIGLGLALGSAVVAVERVAVNLLDFGEPDIAGAQPAGGPIVEGAPAAYLASVPVEAIATRMRAACIPAVVSNTAGAFLCNQLMFSVLHAAAIGGLPMRAGFLHMPADPGLVARLPGAGGRQPSMDLDMMAEAAGVAIEAALAAST